MRWERCIQAQRAIGAHGSVCNRPLAKTLAHFAIMQGGQSSSPGASSLFDEYAMSEVESAYQPSLFDMTNNRTTRSAVRSPRVR